MQGTTVASEALRANLPCHLVKRGHRFRMLTQEPRDTNRPRIVGRGWRREAPAKA
jgi:hypothetical protein